MRYKKSMLSVLCALGLLAAAAGAQAEGWCESGKAVKFAGLNWESGTLLTELMQFVLAKGYGCTTDSLPGNSITMEQALSTNDIQVFAEEWIGRSDAWNKAAAAGKVVGVGEPIVGAEEGLVRAALRDRGRPAAQARGEGAEAALYRRPGAVRRGLPRPGRAGQGRFYNCPAGWTCELENSEMLKSYGLEETFTNFRPGTGRHWTRRCCRAIGAASLSCSTTGRRRR